MDKSPQLDRTLGALRILQPHRIVDAIMIAKRTDLTLKQAGRALSVFHQLHYLAKVGANSHYAQYVRTQKPLPVKGSSVQRAYRNQLKKKNQQQHTDTHEQIARKIYKDVAVALSRELRRQFPSIASVNISRQLSLFGQS